MKKSILAFLLLFSLVLVACAPAETPAADAGDPAEVDTAAGAEPVTEASDEPRIVSHAMGETTIEGEIKRVVILTNEGTEALLALGITPVGAVRSWIGDPWYDHIAEQMTETADVGTESQVNIEVIAALEPDLIIGNKLRQEAVYDQLSMIAPTVFSETLKGDWQENFSFYAGVLDLEEKGHELMDAYQAKVEETSDLAGDRLDLEISVLRFLGGSTRIYQLDSFSGVILSQVGFSRPASQNVEGFAEVIGKERLAEADGDVIFYFTYETGDGEGLSQADEWLNDPLFQTLEAAQNERVFEVSDPIWNTSGGILAANLMLEDLQGFFQEELQ